MCGHSTSEEFVAFTEPSLMSPMYWMIEFSMWLTGTVVLSG